MADVEIPQPSPTAEYTPRDDEKTMAILAHVLQLVGWWIAPLIIFLVKRESRFVSFHALQALFLQLVYVVFWMVGMAGFFVFMFTTMPHMDKNAPPTPFFALFPLLWLGGMGMWILLIVVAILYGIKAGRGEWAEYPLLGPIAKRIILK